MVRMLFHRVVLVGAAILLQLALLVVMLVRFERYFVYFYAVCFLLSLLVVLAIINGRSNPGYKIAWLIPILLFPIFGGLFYLMFGQNHLSRRERKKMAPLREEVHQLLPAENPVLRQLERESPEAANQARYIEKRAYAPLTKDSYSEFLPSGESKFERMKAELTGRLIEYSACKEVAAQLGSRARDLYTVAREPMPLVGAAEYTRRHDPNWLVQAWFNLMGRSTRKKKPTQEKFEPLVTAPFVSVASRVSHMLRGLLKGSLQKMGQLFSHEESRSTNVATFLALLELIRAGRVKVDDSGTLQLDRTHRRRKDKTP